MMNRLRFLFQNYWVELLLVPPFVVAACYFLYGEAYFASLKNLGRMTFPWIIQPIFSASGCHTWPAVNSETAKNTNGLPHPAARGWGFAKTKFWCRMCKSVNTEKQICRNTEKIRSNALKFQKPVGLAFR